MQSNRLHVSNLPFATEEADLRKLFSPYGKIIDIYIPKDKQTGRKKGFAFVAMSHVQEAIHAKGNVDKKVLENRIIAVSFATPKEEGKRNSRSSMNTRKKIRMDDEQIDPALFIKKATGQMVEAYIPQHVFSDFAIDARIKELVALKKYAEPTEIQDKAIPYILDGKDVLGLANTGTGKTATFLLPLIDKILKDRTQKALIIVPTRELALQIREELFAFTKGLPIRSALVIGGSNINKQIADLRRNPQFIIGTPGRLKDLTSKEFLNLSHCHNIVLDEVDRMLDMGFITDIQYLISFLPPKRQTLFFSATMPAKIRTLADSLLKDPIEVSAKRGTTAENIDQDVVHFADTIEKLDLLCDLLEKDEYEKVLIFHRTKRGVEDLSKRLAKRGLKVASIHGDKRQQERQRALQSFKTNVSHILVATDVAARGLDINNVTHVINYELPATYDDYVHRIGRTGRANKKGIALTFVKR